MKNILVTLFLAAVFVVAGGMSILEAHAAGEFITEVMTIEVKRDVIVTPSGSASVQCDITERHRGTVTVRYFLIDPRSVRPPRSPIQPKAVLMLFMGGDGRLNLQNLRPGQDISPYNTNFVVRTREIFAAAGYVVVVVDAASDFLNHIHEDCAPDAQGFRHGSVLRGHREPNRPHSEKYVQDLSAVMQHLRRRYPNLPLWAVGTSRGTESAVVAATAVTPPPDGIVLTSTLTGPSSFGDVYDVNLQIITNPVLIVSNLTDLCRTTKPRDSRVLGTRFPASRKVEVRFFKGPNNPSENQCGALSAHGFIQIEKEVIGFITRWIGNAVP